MCCGSVLPLPPILELMPQFSITYPLVKGKITEAMHIDYPPGTIKDLRIYYQDQYNYTMTFTATGNDLDYGTGMV